MLNEFPFIIGFIGAAIHVLTGPDHLGAVTPMVVESKQRSWLIGLQWAIGHIVGMCIIGSLFILFKHQIPVETVSANSERIIALTLIVMGAYTLAHGLRLLTKKHIHFYMPKKKLAIGIGVIHGFAGISHLIFLLPTLGFSTIWGSLFYLLGFVVGTVLSMSLFAEIIGLVKHKMKTTHQLRLLRIVSGAATIIIGIIWMGASL